MRCNDLVGICDGGNGARRGLSVIVIPAVFDVFYMSRGLFKRKGDFFTFTCDLGEAGVIDFNFDIGTPQGDCISPVLSAIYLAAGLKIVTPLPFPPPNVRSLFFVDDGLLYCASRKPSQNIQCIERCLDKIQDTLATLGLLIDVDKTELIHFPGFSLDKPGRKLSSPPSTLPLRMRNLLKEGKTVTVQPKNLIRYLGFFFDSELNWNAHVSFYFNRAFSTIRALRMLGSSIRGLGTLQKQHAYQACVLPVLSYGLPLWFAEDGVGVRSRLSKINKVHTHACKWITGCFCTTPIGAREVIAGLPPLVTLLNSQLHGFRARITALFFFFFFFNKRSVFAIYYEHTHVHYRNASRRDALSGRGG